MDWNYIKHVIGEFEEVVIKAAAAISLVIVIIEVLTSKISHLISKFVRKSTTSIEDKED
jgi:hypothetical protein